MIDTSKMKMSEQGRNWYDKFREYGNIHRWLRKNHPKKNKCDFCGTETALRYEWALKKGLVHEKNIDNYYELCKTCHNKYDNIKDNKVL